MTIPPIPPNHPRFRTNEDGAYYFGRVCDTWGWIKVGDSIQGINIAEMCDHAIMGWLDMINAKNIDWAFDNAVAWREYKKEHCG